MDKRDFVRNIGDIVHDTIRSASSHSYRLCSRCRFLRVQGSRYGKELAWCAEDWDSTRMRPNRVDPITECASFYPKGQPMLSEMLDMAWMIDRKSKGKIGFNNTDEEFEVIVSKPDEKE